MKPLPAVLLATACLAQVTPSQYDALRWRNIGPFRGGRTVAADGIPSQPNIFYIAANNGGVWKTTDYGLTWKPIFDDQPTGSIGALAIAPSQPQTIYAGSGEGLQRPDLSVGDGIYKSSDGGATWQHLGLRDGQQISAMAVDPKDPNRVYVAVLGHPYGPNAERGLYRSTDGARTFQKVLYKDENTGAVDIAIDPHNPNTLYAVLWAARQGPWENGAWQGPTSGLYKSTDGGDHWTPLTGGLPGPNDKLGRIGVTVAPSDSNRLYALVDATNGGLYISDDGGGSWRLANNEQRIWGRGSDFACVRVDPRDKDTVYVANTSTYRSTDGGKSFRAIKGAPGGDDYHTIWINPLNPDIILLASDQGATISVNRGQTWSSWYNQPTAQFYHVATDNRFPYWVYGGQQESGSAAVVSRSDYGAITFRDWHPVGVEEYGYVAPDLSDPRFVYGGKATRFDEVTGDVKQVGPARENHRFLRTAPLVFSPIDSHLLFYAGEVVFKTSNGGDSWEIISPDLTRPSYDIPPSVGVFTEEARKEATRRGVVYTIAPSYRSTGTLWAGTDDGLIHVTRNGGGTWTDVTPKALTPWSKVSMIEIGHRDDSTAYAAVNRFRCDDLRPHIYRTHDGGKTWTEIVAGIPANEPVNTVREDPVRAGLLFAGTERAVYVSFDDGAAWHPLRLNMPATSIRDLVIHANDIVVGTHGRGFWILDDMTPLRQLALDGRPGGRLFTPRMTYRVRRNQNTDTPLPPEEPAGQNPPDGAIIYYTMPAGARGPVAIEILDGRGKLLRRYSSADKPETTEQDLAKSLTVMVEWTRPPQIVSAAPGMHRIVWDLRYTPPASQSHQYPISAIWRDTPAEPLGPLVQPAYYTVRMTIPGAPPAEQRFQVGMDPRVAASAEDLRAQFETSMRLYDLANRTGAALADLRARRAEAQRRGDKELDAKLADVEGTGGRRRRAAADAAPTVAGANAAAVSLLEEIQSSDSAPTSQQAAAAKEVEASANAALARWTEATGKGR